MSSDFRPQALDSLLASQRASVYGSSKTGSSDNSWMEDYEIHQKGEDMGLDFTDYLQLMVQQLQICLLYTSPSPRDLSTSRMPSSA